ncbi:fimbria/pilus outer membrane usher protein [Morganella morganii]|uniref:fimbria/pilus outer membrane usher protein n=1 Tax=Morganella morganii TaxID=582 RepID=UPI003EC0D6AD
MKWPVYLPVIVFSATLPFSVAFADDDDDDYEFNPAFIKNYAVSGDVDLRRLTTDNDQMPGLYRTDVYVNDQNTGKFLIKLENNKAEKLQVCLTPELVDSMGLINSLVDAFHKQAETQDENSCFYLSDLIPESAFEFIFSKQQLHLSVPQRDLLKPVPPESNPVNWDEGKAAIFTNYFFNRYTTRSEGYSNTTNSLTLNSGINFSKWRFRNDSQINNEKYTAVMTWLERDIDSVKGKLTLGDFYSGSVFSNGSSLRGVRLRNDNSMLSSRETGFAPVIQGIAKTQAQVKVYLADSGTEIYNTVVPAGPFEINDLLPIYYSGDLLVDIIESDGSVQKMRIPVQSGLAFTRPGKLDFDVGVGKLRYRNTVFGDPVTDASLRYGVSNRISASLGTVFSNDYVSGAAGMTINTPVGAFNGEVIHAKATLKNNDKTLEGNSYKLSYSKTFPSTETYINLSSIQFDTKNYVSIYNAMQMNHGYYQYDEQQQNNAYKLKTQYTLSMSQRLPYNAGSVSVSGSTADYWNSSKTSKQYTLSYTTTLYDAGVIASLQKTDNQYNNDTLFSLSLSIPLSAGNNTYLTANYLNSDNNRNIGTGVSGSLGDSLDYSLSAGQDQYQDETSRYATAGGRYKTGIADFSADYSHYPDSKTLSMSASGAIVGHSSGLLFANTLGNSFAIIKAEGIENAQVLGSDTHTNSAGYAIQPNLVPYRKNLVGIETRDLGQNYTVEESKRTIIPRSGSAIFIELDTRIGAPVVLKTRDSQGNLLPLGATVYGPENEPLTFVGQGGKIFLNLNEKMTTVRVDTSAADGQQCMIDLTEINRKYLMNDKVSVVTATCGIINDEN